MSKPKKPSASKPLVIDPEVNKTTDALTDPQPPEELYGEDIAGDEKTSGDNLDEPVTEPQIVQPATDPQDVLVPPEEERSVPPADDAPHESADVVAVDVEPAVVSEDSTAKETVLNLPLAEFPPLELEVKLEHMGIQSMSEAYDTKVYPRGVTERELISRLYQLARIPPFVPTDLATRFAREHYAALPKTPYGAYLCDDFRKFRPLVEWTHAELRTVASCRKSDIEEWHAAIENLDDRAAFEISRRYGIREKTTLEVLFKFSESTRTYASMSTAQIQSRLNGYASHCEKNPDTTDQNRNDSLYAHMAETIRQVMATPPDKFIESWGVLSRFFSDHRNGITSDRDIFAGSDRYRNKDRAAIEAVISLLTTTADPSGRANIIRSFGWVRFTGYWPTSSQMVQAYYTIS